ncbi:MAG: hypothetical protein CM15mP18_1380 [Methanobacteriota archaeon]|nr:MAG: hypothetical protein CM15mP18_1380 [Euryarchaeota archaeon]
MKRTARTVELGGPGIGQFRILKHVGGPIEVGVVHHLENFERLGVGRTLGEERGRGRPCRPSTIMQSSNSSNPSSNSPQTSCRTVVLFVHPDDLQREHDGTPPWRRTPRFRAILGRKSGTAHTVGQHRGDDQAGQEHTGDHGQTSLAPAPCGLGGQAERVRASWARRGAPSCAPCGLRRSFFLTAFVEAPALLMSGAHRLAVTQQQHSIGLRGQIDRA